MRPPPAPATQPGSAALVVSRPSRPWSEVPAHACAAVLGVMTDIDDTLTHDGDIESAALQALHDLAGAGVPVVAITGRPMGWSVPYAQAWPVDAIVAENGAVALIREGDRIVTEYVQDEPTRTRNARRLQAAAQRVLRELPGTTLARDSAGRVTDIAIDHSEYAQLDEASIERVAQLMRDEGLTATVSSIHVNGWIGTHSKWTAAQWMLRRLYERDLLDERDRWVYVGDSTNDQLMFQQFPLSVGVANLRRFAGQLQHWPAYITRAERGRGFAEVAATLLAARAPAG